MAASAAATQLLVAGRHWAQDLAANPSLPLAMQQAVAEQPGAVDVPVKAGDLVIGDSRLYHSAYENRSDERRTCVTMWWLNWDRCGEQFRRHSSHGPLPPPGSSTGPCRIPVQYVHLSMSWRSDIHTRFNEPPLVCDVVAARC